MKKNCLGDYLITGEIIIIGLAEAIHLIGMLLHWPFIRCAALLGILTGAVVLGGGIFAFFSLKRGKDSERSSHRERGSEKIWYGIFAVLIVLQLIFIYGGNTIYRQGDMTVETVRSFLASDSIYQVNPMTGGPYTQGIPMRLKILCLPTLYASICSITGLKPDFVVQSLIPMLTCVSCYMAFGMLANALFPKEVDQAHRKRACFLTMVALILWVGTYRYGMDGFNLLHSGWRGVTIRNCVLMPWLISLCIRRKWLWAILCVLAEACIVWTLYGCGWCLFLGAGMIVAGLCSRKTDEKEQALQER